MEVLDDVNAVLDCHLPVNAAKRYVFKLHVVLEQGQHCSELEEREQTTFMWGDCMQPDWDARHVGQFCGHNSTMEVC